MKNSRQLWRVLFFILLITALCGGLALPVVSVPVQAAPQMQITTLCSSGTIFAKWSFEGTTPLAPSVGSGALIPGSALSTPSFPNGPAGAPDVAISFSSWPNTSSINEGDHIELDVNTGGRHFIGLTFDYRATSAGPGTLELYYSTDGTNFIASGKTVSTQKDSNWHSSEFDLSSIVGINDNPSTKFKLYVYITGTSSAGGTLCLENVSFCSLPMVTIESIVPNPTNGATTITWHSIVNGTYEVRVAGTSCSDGTVVDSGSYTNSPSTFSSLINGNNLVDGPNAIYVCVTDSSNFTDFVASSVTKDVTAPSMVSFTRQSPTSAITNADTLTFRVTFSEGVMNVDSSDFAATGTTGMLTVTPVSNSVYEVTISGGDLPNLNGTVGLNLNQNQNITDLASNPLPDGEPPVDEIYTLDNTILLTHLVISEFRTTGPGGASDEFIEIYNPTNNWVDISGWKISASNSSGDVQTRATIPASTILRSGQYYLIAHNSYINVNAVTANLRYGTGIADDGGIALLNASDQIIDEVGMDAGSAYQEGTPLSPLTNSSRSYERKDGDPSGSCVDTGNNASDFKIPSSPSPHNYSTIRLCGGSVGPSPSSTTITITGDSPDPSLINGNVGVSVKVTGGSSTPSGIVNITGANTNCTITLSSAGTGSCTVKFTSTGTKTLTATYLGDNTHFSSTDTEAHQVTSTTAIRTPTRVPTLAPPPPLVGINEFVPRPGHDWNNDGVINVGDEYIELINHGVIDVNLSGYSLDDEANIGSPPYSIPAITLKPGERHVFYGSETGLLLSDGGDGVRLLKPNGQLVDAYNYQVVHFPDQSYCRLPDNGGLDDWNQNCYPTPGLQNSLSASSVNPPTAGGSENLCPIADTLPSDFVLAECLPFGNNIWNPEYWDKSGWFDEKYLPENSGKWDVFAD